MSLKRPTKRPTKRLPPKISKKILSDIIHKFEAPLNEIVKNQIFTYGSAVVENRAIPDYRDGLKPVSRRILWTMLNQGLHPNTKPKKSARIVGEVMGKYHPHGDNSIYEAMVTLANLSIPLIDGQGNWGTSIGDPPAAMRYTEARLSKFASEVLLDKKYLEVTPMVNNYDGTEIEPLYLPSTLPFMFLTETTGIAVGASIRLPVFSRNSVEKIVRLALSNKKITPSICSKYLEVESPNGGHCISKKEDLERLMEQGNGSLSYMCDFQIDHSKRQIYITGFPPGWDFKRMMKKYREWDSVYSAEEVSDREGIKMCVTLSKTLTGQKLNELYKNVKDSLVSTVHYQYSITERRIEFDGDEALKISAADFMSPTPPEIISMWVKYRIELELLMLKNEMRKLKEKIYRLELVLKAIEFRKIILTIIDKYPGQEDSKVSKQLKISIEDAKVILGFPIRRFGRLSKEDTQSEIDKLQSDWEALKNHTLNPNKKILNEMKGKS